MKANKRQSYDIEIEAMVEETKCKSDNFLDLKNPYFRYNGAAPQVTNKYLLRLTPWIFSTESFKEKFMS